MFPWKIKNALISASCEEPERRESAIDDAIFMAKCECPNLFRRGPDTWEPPTVVKDRERYERQSKTL
jgi:hypothetical protein